MRNSRMIGRIVAIAGVFIGVVAVVAVLLSSGSSYTVYAYFQNASQIVKGNQVVVDGVPIGKINAISLTPNGQARLTMSITDSRFVPLRQGTTAIVRLFSLSGVASRYVDLNLPPGKPSKIPNGGSIPTSDTTSTVDLDALFNTFDPPTRHALSGVIRGFNEQYSGQGQAANRGWLYLDPSLSTSTRLFRELNLDTPLLTRFVVATSKLVTDLATRRNDLSGLVVNLNTTLGAIAREDQPLQRAITLLPPFMRRANTTFVNLRRTLDDLKPLVDESKPVAPKLRRLLEQLRPLTHDARPTLRDLSALIQSPGPNNDLIEATLSNVPVRNIAIGPVFRNGRQRPGAFPATTQALGTSIPELAYARPYAVDLTAWFDDFSASGVYDALGGESRASPHVNAFALLNGTLTPVAPDLRDQVFRDVAVLNQDNRCPGSMERGSVYKPYPSYPCDASQVPPGS